MNKVRVRLVVALMAMALGVVAVAASPVQAQRPGAPEAVASPYTRIDPTGDCVSGAGPGGPRCDLVKLKVANRTTDVKLIATYAGTPFLPTPQGTSKVGNLIWYLEGATDVQVFVNRSIDGVLYADVRPDPYLGGAPTCWSGDGSMPAPLIDGLRVIVVVPRDCLGDLAAVRVYALAEKVTPGSAAVATDRAPNTGYTHRISPPV